MTDLLKLLGAGLALLVVLLAMNAVFNRLFGLPDRDPLIHDPLDQFPQVCHAAIEETRSAHLLAAATDSPTAQVLLVSRTHASARQCLDDYEFLKEIGSPLDEIPDACRDVIATGRKKQRAGVGRTDSKVAEAMYAIDQARACLQRHTEEVVDAS